MSRKLLKLPFLLIGLLLLLAACGDSESDKSSESSNSGSSEQSENTTDNSNSSETTEEKKSFVIGTTQIAAHPSLDAATKGFKQAIADAGIEAKYIDQNANGDNSANLSIAQKLVGENVDLIFANSTPSAQAVKGLTTEIPIVFTSVTDAVSAELIESMESPGGNVTGTMDLHPDTITKMIDFITQLGLSKVGMVYNAGEPNSVVQVTAVKEAASAKGIEIFEASATTSADVRQATESLLGKVDSFYIITDNTVVTALESVIEVANANKLPLIVGELDSVARGGLAAYGFDYFDIGYEAGLKAAEILVGGKSPEDIPSTYPANLKLLINKATAETIGLEIKEEWNAEVQ